jgi:hypothetical protein
MTREEKARWLSDFYARVAEGEEMLINGNVSSLGPDMNCSIAKWTTRKPKRGVWVLFRGDRVLDVHPTKPDLEGWVYMEEPDG